MRQNRAVIDMTTIIWANARHLDRIRWAKKMVDKATNDPQRSKRRDVQECILCYGSSRIGGAACTQAQCACCDTMLYSGNTNIDMLCISCARVIGICKHCGADMDLKNKRKRTFPERTPTKAKD